MYKLSAIRTAIDIGLFTKMTNDDGRHRAFSTSELATQTNIDIRLLGLYIISWLQCTPSKIL